jgi:hypothetical protein
MSQCQRAVETAKAKTLVPTFVSQFRVRSASHKFSRSDQGNDTTRAMSVARKTDSKAEKVSLLKKRKGVGSWYWQLMHLEHARGQASRNFGHRTPQSAIRNPQSAIEWGFIYWCLSRAGCWQAPRGGTRPTGLGG